MKGRIYSETFYFQIHEGNVQYEKIKRLIQQKDLYQLEGTTERANVYIVRLKLLISQ